LRLTTDGATNAAARAAMADADKLARPAQAHFATATDLIECVENADGN